MTIAIKFSDLGGPVFVGRANGMAARKRVKVDDLDHLDEPIRVEIPELTYSVNSSFFLGMFGPSISHFGSAEEFFDHYKFICPEHIFASLRSAAERALISRGTLALSA
jgi:hypothetical protein